jgi:hypothetical protein
VLVEVLERVLEWVLERALEQEQEQVQQQRLYFFSNDLWVAFPKKPPNDFI